MVFSNRDSKWAPPEYLSEALHFESTCYTIQNRMKEQWTLNWKGCWKEVVVVGGAIKELALRKTKTINGLFQPRFEIGTSGIPLWRLHFESNCLALFTSFALTCSYVSNSFASDMLMWFQMLLIYFWEIPDNTIYVSGRNFSRARSQIALHCRTTVMLTSIVCLQLCMNIHYDLVYPLTCDWVPPPLPQRTDIGQKCNIFSRYTTIYRTKSNKLVCLWKHDRDKLP
jgi:hypothetical protein